MNGPMSPGVNRLPSLDLPASRRGILEPPDRRGYRLFISRSHFFDYLAGPARIFHISLRISTALIALISRRPRHIMKRRGCAVASRLFIITGSSIDAAMAAASLCLAFLAFCWLFPLDIFITRKYEAIISPLGSFDYGYALIRFSGFIRFISALFRHAMRRKAAPRTNTAAAANSIFQILASLHIRYDVLTPSIFCRIYHYAAPAGQSPL